MATSAPRLVARWYFPVHAAAEVMISIPWTGRRAAHLCRRRTGLPARILCLPGRSRSLLANLVALARCGNEIAAGRLPGYNNQVAAIGSRLRDAFSFEPFSACGHVSAIEVNTFRRWGVWS